VARDKGQCIIGVDVGGTNIQAAVVDANGDVLARTKAATARDAPAEEFAEQVAAVINGLARKAREQKLALAAAGVGLPGPVDASAGVLLVAPNLPKLRMVPLRKMLRGQVEAQVFIGNDVSLGTLGEHWRGAARGADSAVGVFVGTGIGGGIVIDGQVWLGAHGSAAELGHTVMQLGGPLCGCGNHGCVEALASRTAIERDIREAAQAGRQTVLTESAGPGLERIRSGALRNALAAEDGLVVEIMTRASEVLGEFTKTIRHVVDPEVFVYGGGVIEACGGFMLPIIERVVLEDPLMRDVPPMRIVPAELGDDAVMMGAVALAFDGLDLPRPGPELVEAEEGAVEYPEVKCPRFGEARVNKKTYNADIVIPADGKVRKRKKKPVRRLFGTSHRVGVEEVQGVCDPRPETLVVGIGCYGMAHVDEEARAYLAAEGIRLEVHPSAEAAEVYNRLSGKKCLLLHVTC